MQLDKSVLLKLCTFIGNQTKIAEISLFNCNKWKNVNFFERSCKRADRTATYAVIVETREGDILLLTEYFAYIQQNKICFAEEMIQKQS